MYVYVCMCMYVYVCVSVTCASALQCRFYGTAGVKCVWRGSPFWTLLREPLAISIAIPVAVKFGVGI